MKNSIKTVHHSENLSEESGGNRLPKYCIEFFHAIKELVCKKI